MLSDGSILPYAALQREQVSWPGRSTRHDHTIGYRRVLGWAAPFREPAGRRHQGRDSARRRGRAGVPDLVVAEHRDDAPDAAGLDAAALKHGRAGVTNSSRPLSKPGHRAYNTYAHSEHKWTDL